MQSIDKLIDTSVGQIVRRTLLLSSVSNLNAQEDFFFKNYPALSNAVDGILAGLSNSLFGNIVTGIEWSWDLSNMKNDDMVSRLVRSIGAGRVPSEAIARWNQKNLPALEAFEDRRIGGMSLSSKVWDYTKGMKGDLELALDLGLGEGLSADKLSRQVRGYLREPDRLYRRVRDEKGVLRLSKSASNYHPGQGVYRSSYKNAKRLASTETNMAYRSADYQRNQQLDFILGIRINLSKNHTCLNSKGEPVPFFDICDELQGDYPKDFKFTGWHPNCRCYVTTILPDKDEFAKYLVNMDENGESSYELSGKITEMPPNYTDWVERNADRIQAAEERGTLPYFLKDNRDTWEDIVNKEDIDSDIEKALGVKKGAPMSWEDANTGKENPHWQSGVNDGYNNNCQTCTVVHELRRRGFDVEAEPFDADYFKKFDWQKRYIREDGSYEKHQYPDAWMRDKGYKNMTEKRVKEYIAEKINGAGRYEIYVKWSGSKTAHVFLAEAGSDGTIGYFDPQTGKIRVFPMDIIEKSKISIIRIDDKKINPDVSGRIIKKGQ